MTTIDPSGSSSDVPKRSKKNAIGKKQIFYVVLPLLLINAGIAHTVIDQIKIKTDASMTEVKDDTTVLANEGEVANDAAAQDELVADEQPVITVYKVQSGDTLSGIADKFNISINTIRWANDLTEKTSKIAIGDELVILPVTGVEYTVKKGDTLSGIALKFDASQDDILKYNDIEADAIKVGTELIIPNAEPLDVPIKQTNKTTPKVSTKQTSTTNTAEATVSKTIKESDDTKSSTPSSTSYATPIRGGVLTQGLHDGSAVDFGASIGTPVVSFKEGVVIVAKSSGYNGGYGNYIVVDHEGSCQTQYSHLSKVSVAVGDKVSMGEMIGLSGNTGRSTGPHLHFNAHGCGGNPFTKYKIGTRF